MKILIISLVLLSACTTTKYRIIHKPLTIPGNCIFEKFTELEKDSMIETAGRKIARNQETCRNRQERIEKTIQTHNQAHQN